MILPFLPRLAAVAAVLAAPAGWAVAAGPAADTVEQAPCAVLVLPAAGPLDRIGADDGFPDPFAMLRRVDAIMQQAFADPAADGRFPVALRPIGPGVAVRGMMVTTVFNGRESCTRQVIYAGNPMAPTVELRVTGDGCGPSGRPAALPAEPETAPQRQPLPRTLRVERRRPVPVQLAQLDN